ncbi:FliM/FliN family flagellar motor switch protein [Dyella koreensis]|uniref:FliM/FliN family flagellar motor switch protein n=1 Tax=Dyella koreensis TaxID=311235 RepID=A0ABW8K5K7_9GAMM
MVKHVGIGSYVANHRDAAWRAYSTPGGSLAIRMDRCLLLAMLGYHYGDKGAMKVDATVPETETEQRFGVATGLALLEVLRSCAMTVAEGGLTPAPQRTPGTGDRVIRMEIEEGRLALSGILEIALDDASLGLIFASASPRRVTAAPVAKTETPLAERLPVAMSARMLTKEVFLDDVMRLQTGDVMPVRLPDTAEVFVGDTLLFQAAVAEHGGSLCLTSFENAE